MKVQLHVRVKGSDRPVFLVRDIDLPFAPWVGLEIRNLTNKSSCLYEHTVEHVHWDANEQCFGVHLKADIDDSGKTSQEIVDADYPPSWRKEK